MIDCKAPCWRCLFVALAVIAVFILGLYLYATGLTLNAGLLYALAVLVLAAIAVAGAVALALLAYTLFRRWCELRGAPPKGQGTREKSGPHTVHLPSVIYKKPDPMIYSQGFLMAQGLAVTWDNPDIWLTELPAPDGSMTPVPSHGIAANHPYRVHALVHNGSVDAPAVGLVVEFSFVTFGVGTIITPIGATTINLAVKGAVGEPAEAHMDWVTPATPGHYCLQVRLVWPDDAEPRNNLGQENVTVQKLNSPKATFQFPVRNAGATRRVFRLAIDTYPKPAPPDCAEDPASSRGKTDRLAGHRVAAHPVPDHWSVRLAPAGEFVLGAGETVNVTAEVEVPDHLAEPHPINVNAWADGQLTGGVTLYIHS